MLFKNKFLALIENGKVRLVFRKWTRPTVKQGGTLLTPVGRLKITSLAVVEYVKITDSEIAQAGYENRTELEKELGLKQVGNIYKIEFTLEADPRIELREKETLSDSDFEELVKKLERLDSSGAIKNWTFKILEAVASEPEQRAIDYAKALGYKKEWFKLNIRKLKNLGLTISLANGYKISPRGKEFLRLKNYSQDL